MKTGIYAYKEYFVKKTKKRSTPLILIIRMVRFYNILRTEKLCLRENKNSTIHLTDNNTC